MAKEGNAISNTEDALSEDEIRLRGDIVTFEEEVKNLEHIREDFARMIQALDSVGLQEFVDYLYSPRRIIWSNLLAGIFRGLGITIGMTIVFAVFVWVLGQFVDFPLIGDYFLQMKSLLENFAPNATVAK